MLYDDSIPIHITQSGPTIHRWWNDDGTCMEQIGDEPPHRRTDCDYGTPLGDLLIEPWLQEALRDKS